GARDGRPGAAVAAGTGRTAGAALVAGGRDVGVVIRVGVGAGRPGDDGAAGAKGRSGDFCDTCAGPTFVEAAPSCTSVTACTAAGFTVDVRKVGVGPGPGAPGIGAPGIGAGMEPYGCAP